MEVFKAKYLNGLFNNCVIVAICFFVIVARIPEKLEKQFNASFFDNVKAILLFFLAFVLVQLIFDVIGISIFRKEKGNEQSFGKSFSKLLRGIYVQFGYYAIVAVSVLYLSSKVAWWFGLVIVFALMSLQVSFQLFWARSIGNFKIRPFDTNYLKEILENHHLEMPQIIALENEDHGFTGGFTGDGTKEKLIIPSSWIKNYPVLIFQTQIIKRVGVLKSKTKSRGVVFAYMANGIAFLIAAYLSNFALNTLSGLLYTICFFTFIQFILILILTSLARKGVHEGDVYAIDSRVPFEDVKETALVMEADAYFSDSLKKNNLYNLINPVPAAEDRMRYIKEYDENPWGAWNASRQSLYLSWSCMSLISRSDFAIIGRPELWVIQPVD